MQIRIASLLLAALAAFAAEDGPGFNMAAGAERANAVFTAGDIVLPQIANGTVTGGQTYITSFEAVNITDDLARVDITFYDSNGVVMTLPLLNDGVQVNSDGLRGTVQGRGFARAVTVPANAAVKVGNAIARSVPEGAIVVTARFSNRVPGERLYSAAIPLETTQHSRFQVSYTNTENVVSSLAVVSANQQTVTFTARNFNGQAQCTATRAFARGQHLPFILTDVLPCTANTNGVVDVQGTTTGLSGVGFLANDRGAGAFVTQQVYGARVP